MGMPRGPALGPMFSASRRAPYALRRRNASPSWPRPTAAAEGTRRLRFPWVLSLGVGTGTCLFSANGDAKNKCAPFSPLPSISWQILIRVNTVKGEIEMTNRIGELSEVGTMDERMKELVAMGAATAANCHPCMDHHLAKCDELGIDREEVAAAVKVGLMVNRGAENAIRKKARELLGETAVESHS